MHEDSSKDGKLVYLSELKRTFPVEPDAVRCLELPRVLGRFYDRAVVDELLALVATNYEAVWRERAELQAWLSDLTKEVESQKTLLQGLGNALLRAEQTAVQVRMDAEVNAAARVEEAEAEAKASLAVIRSERERAAKEVVRLDDLRNDLRQTCRAFVLAQLEVIEEHLPQADDAEINQGATPTYASAEA